MQCTRPSGHYGLHQGDSEDGPLVWNDPRTLLVRSSAAGIKYRAKRDAEALRSREPAVPEPLKAYAGAVSDDDLCVGEHVQGDRRVSVSMESSTYEMSATMAGDSVTLHLTDKRSGKSIISVTLA